MAPKNAKEQRVSDEADENEAVQPSRPPAEGGGEEVDDSLENQREDEQEDP